jgi:alpha-galactosidase
MKRQETLYRRMSDALDRAPRAMVHMICQYGYNDVWTWGERAGGNMWRTNNDLADEWPSVLRNGFDNVALTSHAGPGHWNDLDMLMVGKANWPDHLGQYDIPDRPPRPTKLTPDEQITHISLWSLMASPLLFSGDLSQLDTETIALLTNDDVIDVDQDSLGAPVVQVEEANGTRILSRRMADGSIVVGLFNLNDAPVQMQADFAKFGFADKTADIKVRDLWKKTEVNAKAFVQSTVPAHGTTLLKLQAAH